MSQSDKTSSSAFPWKEVLTFLGMLLVAYIGYLGIRSQIEIPIQATQTAEAKLTEIAHVSGTSQTALVTEIPNIIFPNPVPTETLLPNTPTQIPVAQIPTNTPALTKTLKPDCIYSANDGKGGHETITVSPPQNVNQIIIFMSKKISKDPNWGYSLFEVEAFGANPDFNLVQGGTARASTTQQVFSANKAIDGDREDPSRWSSDPNDPSPQQLIITLSSPQLISRIELYWELAYAVEYEVCISR